MFALAANSLSYPKLTLKLVQKLVESGKKDRFKHFKTRF